jgi:hypothetical protein
MKRLALLLLLSSTAFAQRAPKGQGAVVLRDDAPVYADSKGDKVEWKLKRGDAVAGYTADFPPKFMLDEVNGRVHVTYFAGEQKGMNKTAWMDPKDLSRFTYDGSCQHNGSPFTTKGFSLRWNACFEEARDNKLDALRVLWAQADAAKAPPPSSSPTAGPTPPTAGASTSEAPAKEKE